MLRSTVSDSVSRKPFYGWVIVFISFLIGFTESGVFQNILSIFMKPMVDEFGWSRASVTGSIAFGSVCGGLLSVFVGPILDRYGPRMVSFLGILLLSLGLFAMAFVTDIWQLYLFFGMGRMIAVGVLSLATSVAVANWFSRLRGRAMGITKVGERLGSAMLPLMVQALILHLGWRMAWGALGVVVFFMSGIPALIFLRRRPEDMGLLPDGAPPASAGGETQTSLEPGNTYREDSEPVWTRSQATHTRTFWVLTLINSLVPFAQGGINFHIYPFLTDQGLSQTTAVLILTTISAFGMLGSAICGMLTERFSVQKLVAVNVFGNGVIFLALYWAVLFKLEVAMGITPFFILAAIHGAIHGARNALLPVIWADFFGRRSLGSVYSLANPFFFAANAAGPIFAGICFDLYGSYAFPFYFFVFTFFISGIFTIQMKRPIYPAEIPKGQAGDGRDGN